jgi:hypothetical protein
MLISNVIVGLDVYACYDINWILFITCLHCNTWCNTLICLKQLAYVQTCENLNECHWLVPTSTKHKHFEKPKMFKLWKGLKGNDHIPFMNSLQVVKK